MTAALDFNAFCWDASLSCLRLNGAGARDFLQGQTSADLNAAQPDTLLTSCWLTATGRLRALLEIRLDAQGADVLVLAGDAEAVRKGFDQVIFPADRVRLTSMHRQRRLQALKADGPVTWLDAEAPWPEPWRGLAPADDRMLELWRIQRGWPSGAGELNGDTNPFELGLSSWVSLSKGCYLGQETMAKLAGSGGVKQQLRCWRSTHEIQAGTVLRRNGERAGVITTSLQRPDDACWIGLALVRRQQLDAEHLATEDGRELTIGTPTGFTAPPQAATG